MQIAEITFLDEEGRRIPLHGSDEVVTIFAPSGPSPEGEVADHFTMIKRCY